MPISKESKDKVQSGEGSGMEIDQSGQLDALLNQYVTVLNKNCDTEETNSSTTSKQDNRYPFPSDSKDTQTEIIMAQKRDTNLIPSEQ